MSILPTYFEAAANVAVTRTLPDAIASDAINYGLRRQRRERQRSAGRVVQVVLAGGTAPDGTRAMLPRSGPAAR
jgi:hypothetical protein